MPQIDPFELYIRLFFGMIEKGTKYADACSGYNNLNNYRFSILK